MNSQCKLFINSSREGPSLAHIVSVDVYLLKDFIQEFATIFTIKTRIRKTWLLNFPPKPEYTYEFTMQIVYQFLEGRLVISPYSVNSCLPF